MITLLLYGLSSVAGTPIPGSVYWLTGLLDGVLFIPILTLIVVPFAGRISREKMGRFHYLQSVAPLDGVVLVLTPTGYEFAPLRTHTNGQDYAQFASGDTLRLGDEQTWYRLGKRKFGVTYVPDERVLKGKLATEDELEFETVVYEEETPDGQIERAEEYAVFDKGAVLAQQRGSFYGYTPFLQYPDDGYLVSLSRAINSLRGGGGVRLSEHTQRMTRMEYGGGATMSNTARAISFVGVILIGAVFGTLIFGVL